MGRGNRFQALLALTRFPLLPTAVADSAAGYLIALPARAAPSPQVLAYLAAASGCLYMGGMILNDVADLERDRTLHPGRPLPGGALRRDQAGLLCAFLAGCGYAASCLASQRAAGVTLALLLAIASYDLFLKRWRIPGALAMGACRGLNLTLGYVAGGGILLQGAPIQALLLGAYVTAVTLLSTLEERHASAARWVAILLRGIIPLDAAMVLQKGRCLEAIAILALLPLALGLRRLLPRHE